MKIVKTLSELRAARAELPEPVGLVPTMGYLHAGHLLLVKAARKDNASVVVSIFVNPTQFGPTEDLASYPRDLNRDLSLLEAEGVDLVWVPQPEDMYPPHYQTWVNVEEVSAPLEGTLRPIHFRGVCTVVSKLFNGVQPQRAYFGQKDAQQAAVIRRMVEDLMFPIEITVCPIQREPDGLAMSSRNTYLNPAERKAAVVLSRALAAARQSHQSGEKSAARLKQVMANVFASEPLARVQYAVCVDPRTFLEVETISGPALLLLAVYVGSTRLIDNLEL